MNRSEKKDAQHSKALELNANKIVTLYISFRFESFLYKKM